MTSRAKLGAGILAAWLAGLAVLIQREYFRPQLQRLAEAAIRVTPSVVYFGVMKDGRQVGFASSTVDTARSSITINDYFVANAEAGAGRRTAAWTDVTLTRGMRVMNFDTELDGDGPPKLTAGRLIGDTTLVYGIGTTNQKVDSQRVSVAGPVLLPNMIPLAIALVDPPKVGKRYLLPVLDPATMTTKAANVRVRAESLFTLPDSAVFDSASARWRSIRSDTVRAWHFAADPAGTFDGWVDEQGRVVQTTQLGFVLQRMPYELAFKNWKADSLNTEPSRSFVPFRADIRPAPAAGSSEVHQTIVPSLELSLGGMALSTFALNNSRQRLSHDTLFVTMDEMRGVGTKPAWIQVSPEEVDRIMRGILTPGESARYTDRGRAAVRAARMINPVVVDLARRLAAGTHDGAELIRRAASWTHDSIGRGPSSSNVLNTLAGRAGDAMDHVQLFMTLARAFGVPARLATGLHYSDGGFYHHVWCEVLLDGKWIAVDPTFGEFPADAAHVYLSPRHMQQADFLRLVAPLRITVLSVGTPVAVPPRRESK